MLASQSITVAHAEALLKATPPEQRADFKEQEKEKKAAPIEQLVKLEKEMSQVQDQYKEAESNYGSDLLNLMVAKGYLTKLLENPAVKSYVNKNEPEILSHFELVVNTTSMEEALSERENPEHWWLIGICFRAMEVLSGVEMRKWKINSIRVDKVDELWIVLRYYVQNMNMNMNMNTHFTVVKTVR